MNSLIIVIALVAFMFVNWAVHWLVRNEHPQASPQARRNFADAAAFGAASAIFLVVTHRKLGEPA